MTRIAVMHNELIVVLLTLAVLSETATGQPASAGKCKPCQPTDVPRITLEALAALKPWKMVYASGAPMYDGPVDNELRDGYRIRDNYFKVTDSRTMKDKSHNKYEFTATVIDNVVVETYFDTKANQMRHFYDYPLAITKENGLLYYRCSLDGHAGIDTRYIEIPANQTLSEEGLQYLLKVDSSCNFRGNLHRLPDKVHN